MPLKKIAGIILIIAISSSAKAQPDRSESELANLVTGIDHVPIVVPDLTAAKKIVSDVLKFTVKNGRVHEGIENFFVKFHNDTYLEFVTPVDTSFATGKYYSDFIKKRTGGTSLALSVNSAKSTTELLQQNNIRFTSNSNPVWTSIELTEYDLFYIEYKNKVWKERVEYTTHRNEATALKSVWWISKEPTKDISVFLKLGFTDDGTSTQSGTQARVLKARSSNLHVVDYSEGLTILSNPDFHQTDGIFGFTIQVKSLDTLKEALSPQQLIMKDEHLIYYLKEYNFFIAFTE